MAKLDRSAVDLPPLPVQYEDFYDGHEWRGEMQQRGWSVPGLWGRDGWNLGTWPLTAVALFAAPTAKVWAYVTYVEGDVDVHAFDSEDERDRAVTEEVVFWWRNGDAVGPEDLPETGYLEHHHGPFPGF
ncbi:hypothetical protein ACFFQW_45080 [Umezawaea endophytica]|uniref:Uncharacterized protein n=1 Tax=Umezawaea endophytica TaxID=1654476 RepID=A0A9X2VXE2_9PSEU|nr:hypothetical protein [Umezawaea endophytica]MCS7484675.1 hypothetical protein [Umezawaea endophytica]